MAKKTLGKVYQKIGDRYWFAMQCVIRSKEFQKDFRKLKKMGPNEAQETYSEELPKKVNESWAKYNRRLWRTQDKRGKAFLLTNSLAAFNRKWSVSASFRYPKIDVLNLNSVDLQPAVGAYIAFPGASKLIPWPYLVLSIDLRRDMEEIITLVRSFVLSERKSKTSNIKVTADLITRRLSNCKNMLEIWDLHRKHKKTFKQIAKIFNKREPTSEDVRTIQENFKRCDHLIKGGYKNL